MPFGDVSRMMPSYGLERTDRLSQAPPCCPSAHGRRRAGVAARRPEHGSSSPHRQEGRPPSFRAVPPRTPKLSRADVRRIRLRRLRKETLGSLARRFGVNRDTIAEALLGRPPYDGVLDPGPFPLRWKGGGRLPSFTRSQVHRLRRRALRGAGSGALAREFRRSQAAVRKALYGRAPYEDRGPPAPLLPTRSKGGNLHSLTPRQVARMRVARRKGRSIQELARAFRVSPDTAYRAVVGGRSYEHIRVPPPVVPRPRVARLSPQQVRQARRDYLRGQTTTIIAQRLGGSEGHVRRALFARMGPYSSTRRPSPVAPRRSRKVVDWRERRRLARTCTSWAEYLAKVGLPRGAARHPHRRHGVRLLCASCRERPATATGRLPDVGRRGQRSPLCRPCRKLLIRQRVGLRGRAVAARRTDTSRGSLRRVYPDHLRAMVERLEAKLAREALTWIDLLRSRGLGKFPRPAAPRMRRRGTRPRQERDEGLEGMPRSLAARSAYRRFFRSWTVRGGSRSLGRARREARSLLREPLDQASLARDAGFLERFLGGGDKSRGDVRESP